MFKKKKKQLIETDEIVIKMSNDDSTIIDELVDEGQASLEDKKDHFGKRISKMEGKHKAN